MWPFSRWPTICIAEYQVTAFSHRCWATMCCGGRRNAHTFVGDDGGCGIARGYIRSSEWDFPRTTVSSHKRLASIRAVAAEAAAPACDGGAGECRAQSRSLRGGLCPNMEWAWGWLEHCGQLDSCDCPGPERNRHIRRGSSDIDFYGRRGCRRHPSIQCAELYLRSPLWRDNNQRPGRRRSRKCGDVQCNEYCWRNPCDRFQ